MTVAVIKYNAGNIFSVTKALSRLNADFVVTDDEETLRSADRVIFPGVGEASSAMSYLRERGLHKVITSLDRPTLGICLGQQLMSTSSEENDTACLGIIDVKVKRFVLPRKVPHMGWSRVEHTGHAIFEGIAQGSYFYFVHGYRADLCKETIASCEYAETFTAAFASGNFVGVQFHPEKSGPVGQRMLENFMRWKR